MTSSPPQEPSPIEESTQHLEGDIAEAESLQAYVSRRLALITVEQRLFELNKRIY